MRVAVIPTIRDYPWGAPGQSLGSLAEALVEAGHNVLMFVAPIDRSIAKVAQLEEAGVRVVDLPGCRPRGGSPMGIVRRAFARLTPNRERLRAEVLKFGAEQLFLSQGGTWCGLAPEYFALLREFSDGFSLVCHLNRPEPPFGVEALAKARWLMANARVVYFNSSWTHRLAEEQIARPIGGALYFQYPLRFEFEAPLPWPAGEGAELAMVNRLDTYHKGIDLALEAISRLRAEGIPARLSIYGSGPDEGYLRDLAAYWKIGDLVEFCGHREDLENVWSKHEVLLLPSRFEGLGVSMIEAMGFGRPVIRTPYGGASEWIRDGENGYLCPGAEADLLLSTLRRAVAERSRWPGMGNAAHLSVKRSLDRSPGRVFLASLSAT